jgi:aryl-alcohol dehydrogenase-like predicted oxidoreductase
MKLTLGTVQFGMDYGVQGGRQPSREKVNEMLSLALDKGIDHFDTAMAYGNAQEVLGSYREKHPNRADGMRIISKLAPKAFAEKPKAGWRGSVLGNITESLQKLKANKLEAFLFHNAEYIFDEVAVNALTSVCVEKLAERAGVSIYTPREAMKALEYEEIKVIQIPYNVFDQRLDKCGFFEKAKEKGVEIYARSPLLQGLITMDPEHLPQRMQFAKRYLKSFHSTCMEYKISPLRVAVGYVVRHPGIDYVVFGVDNKTQLQEYLSLQEETIPEELVKDIQKEFEEVEERLVNPVLWN